MSFSKGNNLIYYMIELCLDSNWLKSTGKVMRSSQIYIGSVDCNVTPIWAKIEIIDSRIPRSNQILRLGNIGKGRRWADRGVWGTMLALFSVNSNLI